MGEIIYKTFNLVLNNNIKNYKDFISLFIKEKKIISYVFINIINIFLLISFFIMVAGFGAYFSQEFGISLIYGSIIMSVLCFLVFLNSINGVAKINMYAIPILIILIAFLGIRNLGSNTSIQFFNISNNYTYLIKSILYASYNSIILIPILISLQMFIKSKEQIKKIAIGVFIIISGLSIIIYLLLQQQFNTIQNVELPIVYIATLLGNIYKYMYGVVILVAIFTTAISAGYSFLNNTTTSRKKYLIVALVMCIVAVPISKLGFSNLVTAIYPVFGYIGIIQIFFLLMA